MYCRPGVTVFEAFPNLAGLGLQISHGVCAACLQRELDGIREQRLRKVVTEKPVDHVFIPKQTLSPFRVSELNPAPQALPV